MTRSTSCGRGEPLPVAVDPVAQPAEQLAEVAAGELRVEVAQLGPGRGDELGRVHVAQRVRREVADQPLGPVAVLQAAFPVVRRDDAERRRGRPSAHAPGRSRAGRSPDSSACSISKRIRMCRL